MSKNSILVVDDDVFFRSSVASFLQRRGYKTLESGDGESALELAAQHRPAIAIVDLVLPKRAQAEARKEHNHGVEVARQLKRLDQTIGVVLISAFGDRSTAVLQLAAEGVRGLAYLAKGQQTGAADLLHALEAVRAGYVLIRAHEPSESAALAERFWGYLADEEKSYVRRAVELLPELSPREREVAYALAHAQTIEAVAATLNIAPPTVEKHINHIYNKLELDHAEQHHPPLRKAVLLAKACWLLELLSRVTGP